MVTGSNSNMVGLYRLHWYCLKQCGMKDFSESFSFSSQMLKCFWMSLFINNARVTSVTSLRWQIAQQQLLRYDAPSEEKLWESLSSWLSVSTLAMIRFVAYSPPGKIMFSALFCRNSSAFAWAAVRLKCQTGQAYSRSGVWTYYSAPNMLPSRLPMWTRLQAEEYDIVEEWTRRRQWEHLAVNNAHLINDP